MKLNVKALAFSLAITHALGLLFLGWAAAFGWGVDLALLVSTFYMGFMPTFVGGIIGAIWGFVDGLIAGLVIAYLYNAFVARAKR